MLISRKIAKSAKRNLLGMFAVPALDATKRWIRIARIALSLSLPALAPLHARAAFEGFGSATPGGGNGAVTVVTSLADSGPGTLREALSKGNNHRIVFKVGGVIQLQSRLVMRRVSFVTIDGATAPYPGITLQNHPLYIRNSHDIVVTHLRVRASFSDGILVWDGSYNVVIDHCSVTNSVDENINITENTHDVTVSWSIIGDTRSDPLAPRSRGMLIANFNKPPVTRVSLHHNLFINEFQRSPQISTAGLFDMRNNVIRDWISYGIRVRNGATGNIINNVFDTKNNHAKAVVIEPDEISGAGRVYIDGNAGPGTINVNRLGTASMPFPAAPVTTDSAAEVELKVFGGAGAFPRDQIDTVLAGPAHSTSGYIPAVSPGEDTGIETSTESEK